MQVYVANEEYPANLSEIISSERYTMARLHGMKIIRISLVKLFVIQITASVRKHFLIYSLNISWKDPKIDSNIKCYKTLWGVGGRCDRGTEDGDGRMGAKVVQMPQTLLNVNASHNNVGYVKQLKRKHILGSFVQFVQTLGFCWKFSMRSSKSIRKG